MTPRLLNVRDSATYLGVSFWTCRDLINAGTIPVVQIPAPRRDGRIIRRTLIDRADLDRFIDAHKERLNA